MHTLANHVGNQCGSIHTSESSLSYKLTALQLVSSGSTLLAGFTMKFRKEDTMLITEDI